MRWSGGGGGPGVGLGGGGGGGGGGALWMARGVGGGVLRGAEGAKPQATAGLTGEAREILVQHCVKCHGGEKTKGEFDLTTREGLLHPGHEGVNVVPGDARASRLMKMVRHEDDPPMPAKA